MNLKIRLTPGLIYLLIDYTKTVLNIKQRHVHMDVYCELKQGVWNFILVDFEILK
jgi:hypothetical protein